MKIISSLLLICFFSTHSFAIDNPDTLDYVAEFLTRSNKLENIRDAKSDTQERAQAHSMYLKFLDKELNDVYSKLSKKINSASKKKLIASQKKWLQFRDAEFEFVDQEWTHEKFGSSSVISRQMYRSSITKNRIIELLHYYKNYSD